MNAWWSWLLTAWGIIGEGCALGLAVWAAKFNRRFVRRPVRVNGWDLAWFLIVQLTWPIAALVLVPYATRQWRRAVRNEICLCGHRRDKHQNSEYPSGEPYTPCDYKIRSSRWLVSGEGDEWVYCECPKFTYPNVRPRR